MKLRSLHPRIAILCALAAISLSAASTTAYAQGIPAEQAHQNALKLISDNNLPEAATALEKFLKDYPTSMVVADAQYRLATVYFMLGEYDKSRTYIQKTQQPPTPPDYMELGAGLLPQVLAGKASKETSDTARKAGFEEAIKEYDNFLSKYPASTQVESATYGRAICAFQIAKYDDAIAGLRKNLQQFPRSDTILDSQFLLGLCLMTQGALTAQETSGKTNPKADALFAEAERFLADIVTRRTDIALLNDAQFQLGELYVNHALFAPPEAQDTLFAKALSAYRAILPKEDTVAAQKARIKRYNDASFAALQARDVKKMNDLARIAQNETSKLAGVEAKADLTVSAKIKIGQLFYLKKAYDEARVVFRQMQQFAEDNEQRKSLLYYLTMSYADQARIIAGDNRSRLVSRAVQGYEQFQDSFKGDPIADNLPFTMGLLFLAKDPEKAISYFQESAQIYPKGRVLDQSLAAQANANVALKRYDAAEATFQKFLSSNPDPALAADAKLGIANIQKDRAQADPAKLAQALVSYQKVASEHRGTPQAETAAFWIGQIQLQTGSVDAAIASLSGFLKDFPKNALLPHAKLSLAQAYATKGDAASALRTFKEIASEFPDSEVAPYAYLAQCNLLTGPEKADERAALMREFIRRYPGHEYIFFAYNLIAQDLLAKGQAAEATATFTEMVEKHPTDPQAPTALFNVGALWNQQARNLGSVFALNDAQKTQWTTALTNSNAACEKVLSDYPESAPVAMALQYLLTNQKLLASVKAPKADGDAAPEDSITAYFETLASRFETQPATRSKILFALAAYTYEKDKAKALEQMSHAYDPGLLLTPANIDLYGGALLEQGKVDEAAAVFAKLATDFPDSDPAHPEKSPAHIQEAQSVALFGQAKVLQAKGQTAEAAAKFENFKRLYPNASAGKILEANYGIAVLAHQQKQDDKALPLLNQVIRGRNASNDLRANAMLLLAQIQEGKNDKNDMAAAIDGYLRIALYHENIAAAASEGLWRGGQLLEKQAAGLPEKSTNPKDATKPGQLRKALKAYQDLVAKYPDSAHVSEAKARIAALGAALK